MNERDKELAAKANWAVAYLSTTKLCLLQEFADLIRADEREACAKVCLDWMEPFSGVNDYCKGGIDGLTKASKAIRARENV